MDRAECGIFVELMLCNKTCSARRVRCAKSFPNQISLSEKPDPRCADTSSASLYVKNKKFLVSKRLAQWQNNGFALQPKLGRGFESWWGGSFFQKKFFFRNDQKISGMMKK